MFRAILKRLVRFIRRIRHRGCYMDIDALKNHLVTFYAKAELTVVWICKGGKRELVYGAVRFLPKFLGSEDSLDEQGTKVGGKYNCRIYFIRHVVDVGRGLSWYQDACKSHQVLMPWQNDDVIFFPQTASSKDTFISSPALPQTFYSEYAPFRDIHGVGSQVCHVMPTERLPFLEELLSREEVAQWINDRLLWKLSDNVEYLGSLNLAVPNPYYHRMHVSLMPTDANNPHERVRFWFDRDCSGVGLRLCVEEKVRGEYGSVKCVEITSQDFTLKLAGIADEVAYSVVDKNNVTVEKQEAHSFIRKIVSSFSVGRDVDVANRAGQTIKTCRSQYTQPTIIGDNDNLPELLLKGNIIRLKSVRERQEQTKDQYVYYQDEDGADCMIKSLIGKARHSLVIIDPYFSHKGVDCYLKCAAYNVDVKVICSPEGLKLEDRGAELLRKVSALNKQDYSIKVEVAGNAHVHDRFILIDDEECWLLGSSVQSLGGSLSVIVKLLNGCVGRIKEDIRKMPLVELKAWRSSSSGI